ncbi:MAG: hypothetical protein MZV63_38960 [Marinilabiliales bacterium]|nr:hypothetical protein [Marinilabiliales bacterium]
MSIHLFTGPHPAGNVGVQIHHIDPVVKGEVVWTIDIQDVVALGRLFDTGFHDRERIIALAGTGVLHPEVSPHQAGGNCQRHSQCEHEGWRPQGHQRQCSYREKDLHRRLIRLL